MTGALPWRPDVLGSGFEAATIDLAPDNEGPVVATLVRSLVAGERPGLAVLYLHGYNDYFFQRELAAWVTARGADFYALDLRKYGRSLRPYQTANYTDDLGAYDEELDVAAEAILAAGHPGRRLLIAAHSTGGLTTPLWVARRRHLPIAGILLNSPFLEFKQPAALRAAAGPLAAVIARSRPLRVLPAGVSNGYGESIHHSMHGEWEYDLAWKPSPGFPIRVGWVTAIRHGHRVLHAGLDLRMPVLCMSSTRTVTTKGYTDETATGDAVLDGASIARWAPALGRHVTVVRVEGGLHDLLLSPRPVRQSVYDTMATWWDAWVRSS